MNTPAHLVLNALVLGHGPRQTHWRPILLGALLPDLPMFGFYLYQRVIAGADERLIWSSLYFEPAWQAFFDVFNSLPLIALGMLAAWRLRSTPWLLFFASMLLHCLLDLPLHREDAHGHFFPLSSWRFMSPVSYWDPKHHGLLFAGVEVLLTTAGAFVLWRRSPRAWRVIGVVSAGLYLVGAGVAFALWSNGGW